MSITSTESFLQEHNLPVTDSFLQLYLIYERGCLIEADNVDEFDVLLQNMLHALQFYCQHAGRKTFKVETLYALLCYPCMLNGNELPAPVRSLFTSVQDGIRTQVQDYGALLNEGDISSPEGAKQATMMYKSMLIGSCKAASEIAIGIEEDDETVSEAFLAQAWAADILLTVKGFDGAYHQQLQKLLDRFEQQVGRWPSIHP